MAENKLDFIIPTGVKVVQKQVIKFGNPEDIKPLFIAIAKQIDETIEEFQWFPFYDEIIEWLSDDKGDGLILYSEEGKRNNGLGKSLTITKIYPILLENYISPAKKFYILNCTDLDVDKINELRKIEGKIILIIDEMGRESKLINDFGTKIRPMETVMEIADRNNWKVVIATNLSKKGALLHYESFHLFERIKSKCKPIECSGESKRTVLK